MTTSKRIRALALGATVFLLISSSGFAQGFYDFVPAIPIRDASGVMLPNGNTEFADGTFFQPVGDEARSDRWAWRPYGIGGILSSLGPSTSTPPAQTRELVTTVSGLEPTASYSVKVLFWSSSQQWGVRAGVVYANGTRSNPWFDNQSEAVILANMLPWGVMPTMFSDSGGRSLYAGSVGIATANASGEVKVYIHDFPASNAASRTWYQGVAVSKVTASAEHTVDFAWDGIAFSRGVRGLALADVSIDRGEYHVGIPRSLEVARGSAIRGVATGLAADLYDWRTRNGNQPRPPTLQFLRYSRDFQAELWLGANIRGIVEPDPNGGFRYFDTNTTTLAAMAAEWVRYVNHIVPTYRQGDTISDSSDAAILNSLTWSSDFPGDAFDTLLAPGEAEVPLVQYWEIGNEPTIGVGSFSVNNSYTLNPAEYHTRYAAVANAIKTENPLVKVGPTLVHAGREDEHLRILLNDNSLPVDFITYHPYEKMGLLDDPAEITLHLGSIHSHQMQFLNEIKQIVAESGRDTNAMEYAATEVNVSNWDTNDSDREARMAHALGTVETIFSHARLGLVASHYWIWPTHRWDGTEYPVFKAYQKLRDHLGDTLLSVYAFRDVRVYVTRDSRTGEIAVWGLNFSEQDSTTVQLNLADLPPAQRATLHRLEHYSGTTSLLSLNASSEMPGGQVISVDWNSSEVELAGLDNFEFQLPAATLSLLVIEPGLGQVTPEIIDVEGQKTFSVRFNPVRYASGLRYELLSSTNLIDWLAVAESSVSGGQEIQLQDNQPMSQSRFYRVRCVRT